MSFNGTLKEFIALTRDQRKKLIELKLHDQPLLNISDKTFQDFRTAFLECESLETLDLTSNQIGALGQNNPERFEALCAMFLESPALSIIQTLHLNRQSLHTLGFDLFEKLFKTIAEFKRLHAFHLNTDDESVDFLRVTPYYNRNSTLNNTTYVQIFKKALSGHKTLALLDLKDNYIGKLPLKRQREIYNALSTFGLKALNLEYNFLFCNPENVNIFSGSLPKFGSSLQNLNIQRNSFKNLDLKSAKILGDAFQKTTLQTLHLTLHNFTLCPAPISKGLKKFSTTRKIENEKRIQLFEAVCNATINKPSQLRTLNLSNSELDETSVSLSPDFSKILCAAISKHASLQEIQFGRLFISNISDIQTLNHAISECISLKSVKFYYDCSPTVDDEDANLKTETQRFEESCSRNETLFFNPTKLFFDPYQEPLPRQGDKNLLFSFINQYTNNKKPTDINPKQEMSDRKLFF